MLTFSTAATRRWAARLPVLSKALQSAILLIAFVFSLPAMAGDFFVATTGSDANPGTLARPFKSLPKAVRMANAGDTIYLRGGTYALSSGIKLSKSGSIGYRINIFAYQAEVPVLDGSAMTQTAYNGGWVLWLADASWLHINGLEIRNGPMGGVVVTGASSNNIIERLNVHHNGRLSQWEGTGISLYGSSSNNLLINNDAHHNADLQKSYADGFRVSTSGTGNVLRGNRAWRNSDDGYDFFNIFKSAFNAPLLLENNWAYENGFDDEMRPTAGDGNGFQLGGRRDDANGNSGGHTLNNNLSWRNRVDGFYENNASDALTLINNSAYNNGQWNYAFWTTPHVFYNNLSSGSMGVSICCGANRSVADHNSWTLPVAVSAADFLSLDSSLATGPRAGNGDLPDTNFLRLAPTSDLIDKGVNVGLAYAGQKPDLGAYEASGVRPAGSTGRPLALAAGAATPAVKDPAGDQAKSTDKVAAAKPVNSTGKVAERTEPKPTPASKTPAAPVAAMFDAPGWPDFDIRLSDEKADHVALERMRDVNPAGRLRAQAARDQRHEAQRAMEARTQKLHIIESRETGAPEVIGPARGKRTLTGPRTGPRERIARDFLEVNAAAYGLSRAEAARLVKDADYANPAGNLHWVRLQQRINNRPVFRGEVTVAMTPTGEIARTTGQLAIAIDEREAPKTPVFSAAAAVSVAAGKIGVKLAPEALVRVANTGKDDGSVSFQRGPFTDEIRAELMYFPLGDGSVDLAWSTVLWTKEAAYWSIVGASSGERLFQKNLSSSVVNTYSVYPSDSPAPMSPGPVDPTLGTQGVPVARSLLAIDELSTTMNDPWLGPGITVTDGNNVEAGLDIDGINGVDFPVGATAANTFNYAYNPAPGNPAPADAPTTAGSRNGAVVNLFYLTNRYHDQLYDLGFTEAARNFQADNYGRGGVGGDRISAEAQDSSGTNNANFSTPADGGRGRMQMYVWTGPTPDRDGDLDAEVVYHELTHGTSNRLHGNASGLSTNMARGMGEGWSDFYAEALLSEPTDPINGIYTTGGYATYEIVAGFTGNYYYGIRRFPRAPISFLGSNGKPHNPLLFADIDSTQARDLNTIGAFPRGPIGVATLDQVHNLGEIWSSALWDARAKMVTAQGHAVGNTAILQNVTDGMKLDPVGPTFLQARDSIIAADCAANAGVNEINIWAAFAARGMGLNAQVLNAGTGANNTRVVQDFTGPTLGNTPIETGAVSYVNTSCGLPDRNPIPGETVDLTVGLTNPFCSQTFTNVLVAAQGGGSDAVGTLAAGASTTATVPYTIPADTPCGSTVAVTIDITHDQGAQSLDYDISVGPQATTTVSFSNASPISIPATGTIGVASLYPSPITVSGVTAPVVGVTLTLTGFTHTFFGDTDFLLVAPDGKKMVVKSDAWSGFSSPSTLTMDLTLSDDAAAGMPTGGSPANTSPQSFKPTNHGSPDAFAAPAPAGPFIEPQPAGSSTFASAFAGIDPNGTWNLYIVDDVSGDVGAISGGWTLGVVVTEPAICTACGGASLGGTVSGLAPGNEVVLQDNGGDDLTVSADGSFAFATPPAEGAAYDVTVLTQPTTPNQTCLVVNGSGTMPATSVTDIEVNCTTNTYTVGGSVSGMGAGNSVTLLNNGGDDLTVPANGAFTFATSVADGGAYAVTVQSSIAVGTQTCVVDGGTGSGNVAGADVTSISVTCTANTYTVGGDVSGLAAGNSVDLQNNAGDDLTVSADGSFTFTTAITDLGAYDATVSAQPTDPNQTCLVTNGSGSIAGANVTNVSVACTTNTYTVGGSVSGMGAGNSVTLLNNGGDSLTVPANGAFTFATSVADGGAYAVTVQSSIAAGTQTCVVDGGTDSGNVAGADVTSVSVTCTPNTYTVGGNVSGLAAGNSVDLQNNGGDDLTVSADGSFTFTTAINDLGAYDATVSAQPSDPNQTCVVSNGSGFLAGANVTNVSVDCTTNSYTVGGTLSGLGAGNSITLRNSGGDDLVVSSDGSFAFATGVTDGGGYAVTVFVQPTSPDQTCAVTNDTGTIAGADVTDVTVTCKYITQVSVTGYNVTYDGLPHTATGAALDVDGNPLAGLDLSATTRTNVGVTNDAWTFTSPNANYTDDSGSVSDEIGKATLTVTADNLSRFFLDANPPLTYTITGFVNNETAAVISGTPDCTTTANPASPLGPYPVTCTVGTLSAANYEFVFVAGTLNVLPRSALVNYIGQTTWVTSGSKSTTAQVTLSASVQDVTGVALVGATVSFKDLGTGKYLATNVKVAPVANAPGTGTANTIVTLSSGQYGAESYLILVEMTGGYDNTLQPAGDKTAVVAVAKTAGTNQTIGIGSFAALSSAAGTFKGNGDDVGYTIGLSYTKSGANLKGKVTISVPQADGVLWIKSNAISSMAAVTATNPKTSTIYTKATVYKATPAGVVTIDGNVSLRIDAVDGSPDKVGVTVLSSKDSTLYYSNQWLLVPTGGQSVWKTVPETVINAPPTTVSTVSIQ